MEWMLRRDAAGAVRELNVVCPHLTPFNPRLLWHLRTVRKLPSSGMFQQKRWNKAIVQREGRDLMITVPRPGGLGDGIVLAVIVIPVVYGLSILSVPLMFRAASPVDFLLKASLALVFDLPFFFIFRGLLEREFADQVVTVSGGRITWARRTKWWMRKRHMNADQVTDISASTGWSGLGRVDITAKGHQHTILERVLNADAIRLAREMKQSTLRDNPGHDS
jgi:hypothetical protein